MNYQEQYEIELEQRAKELKDWEIEALLRFKDDVDDAISDYYDDEQEDKYENDKELVIKIEILQNYHDNCGGYYNKYFDDAMKE